MFNRYFNVADLETIVTHFKAGFTAEVGDMMPSDALRCASDSEVEGLNDAVDEDRARRQARRQIAAAVEFVLEGLHLNKRLNKDRVGGRSTGLAPVSPAG